MGIVKLSTAGILDYQKYSSVLAGNAAFSPSSFDLLESQVLTSSSASVTFTGLDSYTDYKHLQVRAVCRNNTTSSGWVVMRANADSGANYVHGYLYADGVSVANYGNTGMTVLRVGHVIPSDGIANNFAPFVLDIFDFSNTNKYMTIRSLEGLHDGTGASNVLTLSSGAWLNTAAVTSLTFTPPAGDFETGTRISIYGVKL